MKINSEGFLEATDGMDLAAVGVIIRLLCLAELRSDGTLPANTRHLKALSGLHGNKWRAVEPEVLEFFQRRRQQISRDVLVPRGVELEPAQP